MQQQLSSKSLSVGTKLLIVIGVLLFFVILFLNLSAILIVGDDKRAYIYEAQGSQTVLVGTEFVNNGARAIDLLRLSLANADPLRSAAPLDTVLRSLVENQNDLVAVVTGRYTVATQSFTPVSVVISRRESARFPQSLSEIPKEAWPRYRVGLEKRGVEFFNATRVGLDPYMGVVITDPKLVQERAPELPIAIGFLTLKDLSRSVQGSSLTIASSYGEILFDSDLGRMTSAANLSEDTLFLFAKAASVDQGAHEYEEEGRRYLGSFVRPGFDLVVTMRTDWNRAQRTIFSLVEKFLLLGFIAVGLGIVLAILFAKSLTRPITQLFAATQQVAQGDFNIRLEVTSQDEIGALTESFNTMSAQITDLVDEKIEKVKLENELDIAATVQQTLIPPPVFENETIQIASHYESASQCGGDWWGFFCEHGKTVLMIADATGHGFPSALITASARSCFSFMHKLASEDPDFTFSPAAMLAYANRVVFEASLGNIMMTFFIGVYDPETGQFSYSSAGHNPPWLFKHDTGAYKLKSLTAVGNRLGEGRDVMDFEEHTVSVSPNDILFMYTDGILEGKNLAGDMFGKKKVRKLVEEKLESNLDEPIQNLMKDFRLHNQGKSFDDDVTLVFAKFKSTPPTGSTEVASPPA